MKNVYSSPCSKMSGYILGHRSKVEKAQKSLYYRPGLNPCTLHLPWRFEREGERGQIELEVIESFPVRSDVSLRLHRCSSSSGCCGQKLLRTHKRDGWPLTVWGKTQTYFFRLLWRRDVLGRRRWKLNMGVAWLGFILRFLSGSWVHNPSPPFPTSRSLC